MLTLIIIFTLLATSPLFAGESVCYGTSKQGRLENGVRLPGEGENFVSYSTIGEWLGRNYVHSKVKKAVVSAYRMLEREVPGKVFKYAETGYKEGGKFWPHKTHQNGLSVDFMVPVINKEGQSVHLPTHPFNKFGYNIEFDKMGRYEEYSIDYEAMSAHIVALHKSAKEAGVGIRRVIFDPKLKPFLLKTKYGRYLSRNIRFSKKRSWVRHDEHYHVDFSVKCKRL